MTDMAIYEKLIILEVQKRIKDEEEEIFEIVSEKSKQCEAAYHEYINLYWLFARLISSSRNITTILKLSSELQNRVISTNIIRKEDNDKLSLILRCPKYHYLTPSTVDLMRQSITSLRFNKKILNDIYYYIKQNKDLKEAIDNTLIGNENALTKCVPNLVDMVALLFDPEE